MLVFGYDGLKQQGVILAILLISSLLAPNLFSETYGDKLSITKIICKAHISNYIKLGELSYKERYKHNRVVDNCIKLFKDKTSELYINTSKSIISENKNTTFKIISDKSIGKKYHLVKYQVCNNEKQSQKTILFQSISEKSLIHLPKPLMSNLCTMFWTKIVSENVDSATVSWATNDLKPLKIRKIF
ncbi:MAG: hypothetical protein OEW86_02955 [Nitrosopumilus sp.]|nr:hypothetical protein [Nitrosopumilus sp.]